MNAPEVVSHPDMLARHLPLAGRDLLDVGCGDGALARALRRRGARVWGIEPVEALVAAFNEGLGPEDGRAEQGVAEDLPFPDGRFDGVLFFNSLHHLPSEAMAPALDEAWRVTTAGGRLLVVEPVAAGPYFELIRGIEDETAVRAQAQQAIAAFSQRHGLRPEAISYTAAIMHADAAAVLDKLLKADAARAPAVERERATVERRFSELGEATPRGTRFLQPMSLHVFTR